VKYHATSGHGFGGTVTRGKVALGFAAIACSAVIAAFNVMHGSSVSWTGLGLACVWSW
jgi:hypothetical protein